MTKKLLMQILAGMPDDTEIEAKNSKGEELIFTHKFEFWEQGETISATVVIYFE
jgi:hypothetical protein